MNRILLFLSLAFAVLGYAQLAKEKARGEVVYESNLFKPAQNSNEEREAIIAAKKNALVKFAAKNFDKARLELYQKIEPEIFANLDQYVIEYVKLEDEVDKNSKRYIVTIEATINTTRIENAINKNSAAFIAAAAPLSGASYMTFVFVARELASRKMFDAKRSTFNKNEENNTGFQQKSVAENGQSASSSLQKTSVINQTMGGETEIAANQLKYQTTTLTEVDNAVNSVLTQARYEVVDPGYAGLNLESFRSDYSTGKDISPNTLDNAIKILREKEFRYLAIAYMDVGLPETDSVSGLPRVTVTVTAKVSDLTPKFPKTVASIAGKPYSGLGSNPEVAKQNALNEAATRSASELVDQMREKNIK